MGSTFIDLYEIVSWYYKVYFVTVIFLFLFLPDDHRGLLLLRFPPVLLKTTREESKMSNFHTTLFKIVLYWCLDLIRHNIGTKLKLNKYIFDISVPFCHHLYLYATLKQCFTEFAILNHVNTG
jgi:hypothetical protein